MKVVIVLAICLTFMSSFIASAPQNNPGALKYAPYNYDYKVEDAEQKLFHDKTETGDETGKVRKTIFKSLKSFCDKCEFLIY
jgi:hypothetical protein